MRDKVLIGLMILYGMLGIKSCSVSDDRLYYKILKTENGEIHWFMYSRIGSFSSDYVLLKNKEGFDTLCVTSNLYDLRLDKVDSIELSFDGVPMDGLDTIEVPSFLSGFKISVNTANEYRPEEFIHKRFKLED
jgi:hypothetical protein